jgi:hypothetical protein
MMQADDGDLSQSDLFRDQDSGVPGDDFTLGTGDDRDDKIELPDAILKQLQMLFGMSASMVSITMQTFDWKILDLLQHPFVEKTRR